MTRKVDWFLLATSKASLTMQYAAANMNPSLSKIVDFKFNYYWYNAVTFESLYTKDNIYNLGSKIADWYQKCHINFTGW